MGKQFEFRIFVQSVTVSQSVSQSVSEKFGRLACPTVSIYVGMHGTSVYACSAVRRLFRVSFGVHRRRKASSLRARCVRFRSFGVSARRADPGGLRCRRVRTSWKAYVGRRRRLEDGLRSISCASFDRCSQFTEPRKARRTSDGGDSGLVGKTRNGRRRLERLDGSASSPWTQIGPNVGGDKHTATLRTSRVSIVRGIANHVRAGRSYI